MVNPSASENPALQGLDPRADHFAVLGVPRRFQIDMASLEQRYLELASEVHPDRFAGADSGERRRAMERSSVVNEAYRTLRDPVKRAEYLCKLDGIDLDSSDPEHGAPQMGQEFLMDMIERRETLAERRAQGPAELDAYRNEVEDEMEEVFDAAVEQLAAGKTREAARTLVVRRYLQRLIDEIDGDDGA